MLVSFNPRGPLKDHWYPVNQPGDVVDDKPLGLDLLKEQLVLWRGPSGHLIAGPDRCPHRKAQLRYGYVDGGNLVCPSHTWTFGEGGKCVHVPMREVIGPECDLPTYRCEERHGLTWVCLGDPVGEIPGGPHEGDAHVAALGAWKAPAARIVELLLQQDAPAGSTVGFELPFTYRKTVEADGYDVLVAVAPIDATNSLVFVAVVGGGAGTDALEREVAAVTASREAIEAVPGMFELDETPSDDLVGAWRQGLLDALSTKV